MPIDQLTSFPDSLEQGSTWSILLGYGSEYPNDEWTAKLSLWRPGEDPKIFDAVNDGGHFGFDVTSAQSAGINPGVWNWSVYLTETATSDRLVIDEGTTRIKPNRLAPLPLSEAATRLKALSKTLLDLSSRTIATSNFNGQLVTIADLRMLREEETFLRARVIREQAELEDALDTNRGGAIDIQFE